MNEEININEVQMNVVDIDIDEVDLDYPTFVEWKKAKIIKSYYKKRMDRRFQIAEEDRLLREREALVKIFGEDFKIERKRDLGLNLVAVPPDMHKWVYRTRYTIK